MPSVKTMGDLTLVEMLSIIKYFKDKDFVDNNPDDFDMFRGLHKWDRTKMEEFIVEHEINIYDWFCEEYDKAHDKEQDQLQIKSAELRRLKQERRQQEEERQAEERSKAEVKPLTPEQRLMGEYLEMASLCGISKDCPICFEKLTAHNIAFPSCCHLHCSTCIKKIKNCSICRLPL